MPTKTATERSTELFDQTIEMVEKAVQAAVKIQEETTRRMGEMMSKFGPPQEWPQRTQAMFAETLMTMQRNLEETMRVMTDSARRNLELLQKAFNGGPVTSPADAQEKTRGFWEATMTAMRANAQALVQANTRMLESWAELGRKLNGTEETMKT